MAIKAKKGQSAISRPVIRKMKKMRSFFILPLFNISRNIDFQPGFLKSGLTKINFDNGFEFLRSFSWFAIVLVLALK